MLREVSTCLRRLSHVPSACTSTETLLSPTQKSWSPLQTTVGVPRLTNHLEMARAWSCILVFENAFLQVAGDDKQVELPGREAAASPVTHCPGLLS